MPEETPSLHIDTDWKRQAQEEKRRLAEQEKQRSASAAAPGMGAAGAMGPAATAGTAAPLPGGRTAGSPSGARAGEREMPQASFASLVSSTMTQALFYLGELAPRGGEPVVNLDMAKHHIDTLGILEEKTRGNLTPEEQRLIDSVLYETRMRFVSVASQYVT